MTPCDSEPNGSRDSAEVPDAIRRGRLAPETCFFCAEGPSEGALTVEMYLPLRRSAPARKRATVDFTIDTIRVPRCRRCRSAHARAKWCTVGVTVLGTLAGLGAFSFVSSREAHGNRLGAVIGIGFAFMGFGAGDRIGRWLFVRGIKPESAKIQYPAVRRYLDDGWRIGHRPGAPPSDRRPPRPDLVPRVKRRRRTRRSPSDAP